MSNCIICDTPEHHDSKQMRYLYQRLAATTTTEEVKIVHSLIKLWLDLEHETTAKRKAALI